MRSLKLTQYPHKTPPRWSNRNSEATPMHMTIPPTIQTKLNKQSSTNHHETSKRQEVCHDFKLAGYQPYNQLI